MSDEAATNTETDERDPAWYREEIKRRDAKIKDLTAKAFKAAYTEAGIDTSQGLGAKIAEHYDGEPDVETIRSFAREYEYPLKESPEEKLVEQVHTTTDAIEEVVDESLPAESGDLNTQIAQAQAEEDWVRAQELEMQRAYGK